MARRGWSSFGCGLVLALAIGGCGGDAGSGTQVKVDEAKQSAHQKGMEEFMKKQGQANKASGRR